MKVKGVFTIEAAYIFSILTVIILLIIRLDFNLHDKVVNDSCKIQSGIRLYETDNFYFNPETDRIDYVRIINAPILKEDGYYREKKTVILDRCKSYYGEYALSEDNAINTDNTGQIVYMKNNAALIRKSGRLVQFVGDLVNES